MLLPTKAFPSVPQLPHSLAALSFSYFILRFFWIWSDGKAPLHKSFDTPWNWTPAAGHSLCKTRLYGVCCWILCIQMTSQITMPSPALEGLPKNMIFWRRNYILKSSVFHLPLSPLPLCLFQLYKENVFLLEIERKLWKTPTLFLPLCLDVDQIEYNRQSFKSWHRLSNLVALEECVFALSLRKCLVNFADCLQPILCARMIKHKFNTYLNKYRAIKAEGK